MTYIRSVFRSVQMHSDAESKFNMTFNLYLQFRLPKPCLSFTDKESKAGYFVSTELCSFGWRGVAVSSVSHLSPFPLNFAMGPSRHSSNQN